MFSRYILAAVQMLALTGVLFALSPASPARAQDDLDVSVFYDELEPHGRWFTHPRYGHVWSPDVDDDWGPYSRGQWIYTEDHGWYWEAEEVWGWGPFHYGRWILDDDFGWVWIPGTEWGPAWVAWRYSDEYVGWAPLPPEAEWYEDRGLAFSASYYDAPQFAPLWIFVEPRYLVLPGLYRYALPRTRNVFALGRTRWHTDYRFVNRRIFNAGFDVRHFERITRRPLVRVRLVTSDSPRARGFRDGDRRTIQTYRPRLIARANPPRLPRLVDPPRREFRRDGDRPLVRPGFTPPDQDRRGRDNDKGGITRERDFGGPPRDKDDDRRQGSRGKDDDRGPRSRELDDNRRGARVPGDDQRKDFGRPPRDLQQGKRDEGPPPELKKEELKKEEFRQPRTGTRPPDGRAPEQRQFQQQPRPEAGQQPGPRQRVEGASPGRQQGGGQPPPQRGDGRRQDDGGKKGKSDQDGTNTPR